MINKIQSITLEDRVRFFWFLVSISIGSLVLYVYAVNATAHHVAVRQDLERQVLAANSDIATLEYRYLALQNSITMEKALAYGFSEVKKPLYVSRTNDSSLTFNR